MSNFSDLVNLRQEAWKEAYDKKLREVVKAQEAIRQAQPDGEGFACEGIGLALKAD